MNLWRSQAPHCKKCGNQIDGGEEICPHCDFYPKDKGLRLAGLIMMAVILFFTVAIVIGNYYPYTAAYAVVAMILGFGAALMIVIISFIATPARLGSLFR